MAKNTHIETVSDKRQLLRIIDRKYGLSVSAPLPETYSLGVGSEYGTPFASFAAGGNASNFLALQTGASSKIGIATKQIYQGTNQPEMSLELHFEAFNDARSEVLIPVIKLLLMATGEVKDLFKEAAGLAKALDKFQALESLTSDIAAKISKTPLPKNNNSGYISFLSSPSTCKIIFGDVFVMQHGYISEASVSFSNVLDNNFIPMEAVVTVTITPESPITKNGANGIVGMFKNRITL